MKKSLMLLLFSVIVNLALADTIDYWHVYLNQKLIGKFNANSRNDLLVLSSDLKETDTFQIQYNTCSGGYAGELAFFYTSDSNVIGWNDGSYYLSGDNIPYQRMVLLPEYADSAYWENVFFTGSLLTIPAADLARVWPSGQDELQFWYTHKSLQYRVWTPVSLFSLTRRKE